MLTRAIAKTIVLETSLRLNRNINIMNEQGVIIASGNKDRIDQIHEGALEVVKTKAPLAISPDEGGKWRGSQPGLNLPISFQDQIVGVIGITGNPKEMNDVGGLVKMATELMIKQEFIARQMEWKQRTKEMIVAELLKPNPSYEQIDRGLDLLDTKLLPPYVTVVIHMSERSISNHIVVQRIESLFTSQDVLVGFMNVNQLFIGLCGIDEYDVHKVIERISLEMQHLSLQFRISVSNPFHTLNGFCQSYEDCELAFEISDPSQEIVLFENIEPQALLYQISNTAGDRFASRIFNTTLSKYTDTLTSLFKNNLNIQLTSEDMYIHRNTLVYRINKIKQETGYDPRQFKDALTLQMAIWISQKTSHRK